MTRWARRRTSVLSMAVAVGLLSVAVVLLAPSQSEPKALTTDRSVEESLLDEALAEIDRPILEARFTDDLDDMIRRRAIRILTTYNRTNFFIADGRLRGFEYQLMQQYHDHLKTRVRKRSWPTIFLFIPVPFDQLLPALAEGRGDIAAAGLTITPEREQLVAFTEPYIKGVKEIVVTAKNVAALTRIEDLSGRSVYVDMGTSYAQSLEALNERLAASGHAPVEVVPADPTLVTEDILELVNAGIVDITIADNHLAELWAQALPNIVLYPDLAVREGGEIAWAVRKNNPDLLASLNAVIPQNAKGTLIGNLLFKDYFENLEHIRNPLADGGAERLSQLKPVFVKYAEEYGFDWQRIAALAFQESGLDQSVKSARGAVGVMQVLPQTAAGDPINIPGVHDVNDNVHAGVKYLAHLRDSYFSDPQIATDARADFALAAYNAGPSRIAKLRARAPEEGFDPNVWFSNVEEVARRVIGRETIDYVANVNKYYIAYKLAAAAEEERQRARDTVKTAGD